MLSTKITVAIYSPPDKLVQHLQAAFQADPLIMVTQTFSRQREFTQFIRTNPVDVAILYVATLAEFKRVMKRVRRAGKVPECLAILGDASFESQALAHGAIGFIVPLAPADECKLAVYRAHHRRVYLSTAQAQDIVALLQTYSITPSPIEGQLLGLIAAGSSYQNIAAAETDFSEETIAGQMYNLLVKLHAYIVRT